MAKVIHTCTGCVPIDASIIEAYVALLKANQEANEAEEGRKSAESERESTFEADHEASVAATELANSAAAAAAAAASAASAAGITQAEASVDSNIGDPSVDVNLANKKLTLSFHNLKGAKGDKGDRGDGVIPVVNDLTTGGTSAALSAEMGKTLNNTKQSTLVSGENIKTVNGESILGSGDIVAGDPNAVKYVEQTLTESQKTQARSNIGAASISIVSNNSAAISAEIERALSAEGELEEEIDAMDKGEYIVAWDGASTPTVANIPAGVTVTYDGDSYTGTLVASASTAGKIYLVSDGNGESNRYITSHNGASYSWLPMGSTALDVSGFYTKSEINQMLASIFSSEAKTLLVSLLKQYTSTNANIKNDIDLLETMLMSDIGIVSISATFTQGQAAFYPHQSLDDLREYLYVTALYSDGTEIEITAYSLYGDLEVGTSTVTVSYSGQTDTFDVTVTERMSYTINDLTKLAAATSVDENNLNIFMLINSNQQTRRRSFVVTSGELPLKYTTSSSASDTTKMSDSEYYPIPIPASATKATVTITPAERYIGVMFGTIENGLNARQATSGWQQGSYVHTFTAGQYDFLTINSKYNEAGSTYPSEPTGLDITFE